MSAPDYDRVKTVKDGAEALLLGIPGVHAVGIGAKTTGGVSGSEPVITVFVVAKRDPSAIPPGELIPPVIDGVKTDVIERGVPREQADTVDTDRPRPMTAGVAIMAGGQAGSGTLGFFGRIDDPVPVYVAVTCQHVVGSAEGDKQTGLKAVASGVRPAPYVITITGANLEGSLLYLKMLDAAAKKPYNAYVVTAAGDTPATIAPKLVTAVQSIAGLPAAIAVTAPGVVTITPAIPLLLVQACQFFDPRATLDSVELKPKIAGNVITLSGSAAGDYALYTSWNTDGPDVTHGAFTSAAPGTALKSVADDVAHAVNLRAVTGINAVAAQDASGVTVTVNGAQVVNCEIKPDMRVGQPTNSFCSKCSSCCDDRIGRVRDARIELDTALVRLDPGTTFLAEIKDIGTVTGTHDVTAAEAVAKLPVQKRGAVSSKTNGTVNSVDVSGFIMSASPDPPAPQWSIFSRFYTGAILVDGTVTDFSKSGDSGSAVLNGAREIVGVLFGGSTGVPGSPGSAWVTPIAAVKTAFNLIAAVSDAAGTVQTVPAAAGDHFAMLAPAAVPPVLARMEREITALPAGARYAEVVRRHATEALRLVDTNRRIATVWHRNGGPQLVQRILNLIHRPDEPLPAEIEGRPLADCLARIESIFVRYASPAFAADLRRYGASLGMLAGLTYPQVLSALRTTPAD